jgi:hypothetical protein
MTSARISPVAAAAGPLRLAARPPAPGVDKLRRPQLAPRRARRAPAAAAAGGPGPRDGGPPGGDGGSSGARSLDERIASGEFDDSGSTKERLTRPLRRALAKDPLGPGRAAAYFLAQLAQRWRRAAAERMPVATGDIREIVGQPVFIPLYNLFRVYGGVFRLSFGPKVRCCVVVGLGFRVCALRFIINLLWI